jgi:hypothetical protein
MSNFSLLNIIESTILTEGRVDDAKKLGLKLGLDQSSIDNLIKSSEGINSKHKYTNWLITKFAESPSSDYENIISSLKYFDANPSKFKRKDINQYENYSDLINEVDKISSQERRKIEKVPGTRIVYENQNIIILVPETHASSCHYGKGTTWCTANQGSESQYKSYKERGELYYVIHKNLSTKDKHYKMAMTMNKDMGYWPPKPTIGDFYDAQDQSIKQKEFEDYVDDEGIKAIIDDFEILFNKWWNKYKISLTKQHKEELIKKTKEEEERRERDRVQAERDRARRLERQNEIQSRRESGEYDDNDKVHALKQYLIDNGDWEGRDEESEIEYQRISNRIQEINDLIEDLETRKLIYQTKKNTRQIIKIDARIEELNETLTTLQNELDELPTGDVYDLYQESYGHYGLDRYTYEPNGQEYAIGTDDEADSAAREQVKAFIGDVGYESFREGYIDSYIDGDAVADWASVDEMVRDSPDSYIHEEAELTKDGIELINEKNTEISSLQDKLDETEDEDKIQEIEDQIQELEDEISDIKSDSDYKDYSEEQIQKAIDDYEDDIKNDPIDYLRGLGMLNDKRTLERFINEDDLIEGVISDDGRGNGLASYDSAENEINYNGTTYYIYRVN